MRSALVCLAAVCLSFGSLLSQSTTLPAGLLAMRDFRLSFAPSGTFHLEGPGWPTFDGSWSVAGQEITLSTPTASANCQGAGKYRVTVAAPRVSFVVVDDSCVPRRMILHDSHWLPPGVAPDVSARRIIVNAGAARGPLPTPASASGSWPSFRGTSAAGVSDGQRLPDSWDVAAGRNIRWRTPIPGLAHSSPIVWGDRVFVATAISSRAGASFKPGLYGDGDASDDSSVHRWMLYAIDKRTGKIVWERQAAESVPGNKRHIKSTYASATPTTDGRLVVVWFGSEGVFAFDVNGGLRWHVDLGRVDMGAFDIPAYEWGPASSPIIWNGMVILQCDTQADSFLLALDVATGAVVWKSDRAELPSWGTPTVVSTDAGPELVTNASNFVRAYDPRSGAELWRLGGSSKLTAPTPIYADGLHVIASGRAPERPIFAVRPGARGDLTLPRDATANANVVWSKTGRGSYMPTPLAYRGILYVLANNGVFDAYDVASGREIYRQRLPQVGSGYSASPVAADGRIYLSSEDGDMLVVEAGSTFRVISVQSMGETLMATPALSEGTIYVRGASSLFAIGATQ